VLLVEALPSLAQELHYLLSNIGEPELSSQISGLEIVDRCRCGDGFCATFYTHPKPVGAYGTSHRNVALEPEAGMIILDVVANKIACVEILYRDEIRSKLLELLPNS
jgi:hypothetical protein